MKSLSVFAVSFVLFLLVAHAQPAYAQPDRITVIRESWGNRDCRSDSGCTPWVGYLVSIQDSLEIVGFPGCYLEIEYQKRTCGGFTEIQIISIKPIQDYGNGCSAILDSINPPISWPQIDKNMALILKQAYESLARLDHRQTYPSPQLSPLYRCPAAIKRYRAYHGACNYYDTLTVPDTVRVHDTCVGRYVMGSPGYIVNSLPTNPADPDYYFVTHPHSPPDTYVPHPPNAPYSPLPPGWQAKYYPCPDTGIGHWNYTTKKVLQRVSCVNVCCLEEVEICWKYENGVYVQQTTANYSTIPQQTGSWDCPPSDSSGDMQQCRPFCTEPEYRIKGSPSGKTISIITPTDTVMNWRKDR